MGRRSDTLATLTVTRLDAMMRHPEQLRNLTAVARLLQRFDDAGNDPARLHDFQAELFGASYRAQLAAGDLRRALLRLGSGKGSGWPVAGDADMAEFTDPAWHLTCDPSSRSEEDWEGELRVAERVVRQLRAVGDALAWRVHRYDRRAIIALSRNDSPGPFVGKKGAWGTS